MTMKKLFLIVSLLVSLVGYSQYPPNGTKNQWKQGIALGSKNRGDFNSNDSLILTIDKNGKLLWRGNGANATWFTALDSTSAGSGTVTSIATNNGTGINGGTITTSGTLSIDTTNISTRLFRIKGTDSLAGLIALKLSIADTANMLSAYQRLLANYSTTYALSNDIKDSIQARLKISDTASMLANYTKLSGDSSLNNSIAIFDGTTGKKIKDTKLIVTDYADNDAEVTYISSTVSSFGNGREITIEGADATTGVGGPVFLVAGLPANGNGSNAGIYATRGIGTNKNGGSLLFDFGAGTGTGTNGGVTLSLNSGTGFRRGIIKLDNLTPFPAADKVWQMPDASGTIALTSNLSSKLNISDTAAMLSGYNLQRVTNLGSTTTQNITANSFLLPSSGNAITTDGSSMYIKAGNGNIYIGRDNVVKAEPDGKLSALSFIKSGGTSSQYLMADGSVSTLTNPVTGTGVSGRVTYWNGTGSVTSLSTFTFDGTTVGVPNLSANTDIVAGGVLKSTFAAGTGNRIAYLDAGGTIRRGTIDPADIATTSGLAGKLNISDTAAMLTYYLRNRTGLSDSYAIGNGSMLNATSGTRNIGLGSFSLQNNTDGGNNVAIGYEALKNGSSISNNTAIGYAAGSAAIPTDVENSVYLGYNSTPQAFSSVTNEIVIGASTTGNGSNTVTIGNSSITNNYFTGNVRGGAFIKSGGTSSQFLKADGSVDGNTYATTSSLGSYAYRSSGLAELSGATFTGTLGASGGISLTPTSFSVGSSTANDAASLTIQAANSNYFTRFKNAAGTILGGFYWNGTQMVADYSGGWYFGSTITANGAVTLSNGELQSSTTLKLGANSTTIYLRPNGANNSTGQVSIDNTGSLSGTTASFSGSVTATNYVQGGYLVATGSTGLVVLTSADWGASSEIRNSTTINGVSGGDYLSFKNPTGKGFSWTVNGSSVANLSSTGAATFSSLGTGTVYSNSGTLTNTDPSDSTIKNTINPHKYGLAEILKLQPKSFYYNSDSTKSNLKYGFIAQEVEKIMPDMVRKINPSDSTSKLGLESNGIYVTLVNAIKEQQAQIELLKAQLEALKPKQ